MKNSNETGYFEDGFEEESSPKLCCECSIFGCFMLAEKPHAGHGVCRYHVDQPDAELQQITKRLRQAKVLYDLLAKLGHDYSMVEQAALELSTVDGWPETKPLDGENIFKWKLRVRQIADDHVAKREASWVPSGVKKLMSISSIVKFFKRAA